MSQQSALTDAEIRSLDGATKIIDWYGSWPSFHDCYMLEVHFSALKPSFITLHVYRSFDGAPQSEAIITIYLGRILSNELFGFRDQLLGLTLYRNAENTRIAIEGALNLSATIETDLVSFGLCWPPEVTGGFA